MYHGIIKRIELLESKPIYANNSGGKKLRVLFWMSTSFKTTSRHLMISILYELNRAGHQITVIKKKVDDEAEELPAELAGTKIDCFSIPVKVTRKNNLVARYLRDVVYISACKKFLTKKYDAVFIQSNNAAGILIKIIKKK